MSGVLDSQEAFRAAVSRMRTRRLSGRPVDGALAVATNMRFQEAAPRGFLLPGPRSVPAGFQESRRVFLKTVANIQYRRQISGTPLFSTVSFDETQRDTDFYKRARSQFSPPALLNIPASGSKYECARTIREFTFNGRGGAFCAYDTAASQDLANYKLIYDHGGGRVLNITYVNVPKTEFPPEFISGVLRTMNLQE